MTLSCIKRIGSIVYKCITLISLGCLLGIFVLANSAYGTTSFPAETRWETQGGWIMFLKGAGYEAAKLENGAWHFQGLISNNNNANSTENKIEE